jgi:hypothetical protein
MWQTGNIFFYFVNETSLCSVSGKLNRQTAHRSREVVQLVDCKASSSNPSRNWNPMHLIIVSLA